MYNYINYTLSQLTSYQTAKNIKDEKLHILLSFLLTILSCEINVLKTIANIAIKSAAITNQHLIINVLFFKLSDYKNA